MDCKNNNCVEIIHSLRKELELKNQQIERLQLDLETLNIKYVKEIERVGNIQHEKDLVEHELEELCSKLFQEANDMVSFEKKQRVQVENELKQTKEQLVAEQAQLHELRSKFYADQITDQKLNSRTLHCDFDHGLLNLFKDYIQVSSKLQPKKLNQMPFMKFCLTEDIEPCLRFGYQSKLSMKKIIENLSKQPCFIESHNSSTITKPVPAATTVSRSLIWKSSHYYQYQHQSIIISNTCSACGRSDVSLKYRFKFDENECWLPIDQYCRDRLVAVCEFFVFIRNIQLGLYSDRTLQDLYNENLRLRLQMFYSRLGASHSSLNETNTRVKPATSPSIAKPTTSSTIVNEGVDDHSSISDISIATTGPNTPEPHISPSPINATWTLESSNITHQ